MTLSDWLKERENAGMYDIGCKNYDELVAVAQRLLRVAKFYSTYSPRQHPEGFYEIHVAPGEGGEVRFGTYAKEAIADCEKVIAEGGR